MTIAQCSSSTTNSRTILVNYCLSTQLCTYLNKLVTLHVTWLSATLVNTNFPTVAGDFYWKLNYKTRDQTKTSGWICLVSIFFNVTS